MRLASAFLMAAALIAPGALAQKLPPPGSAVVQPAPPVTAENTLNLDLSTGGRVTLELRPDKAPLAVERIKTLVRRGFYDNLTFHRVIEGFMAQGGDPKGDGTGGSELPDLKAEFNDLPHVRGVLSMARSGDPNSANSQFFIVLSPTFSLDKNYTIIGRVLTGMQYVDALEKGEPPENPSRIIHATIGNEPPRMAGAPVSAPAAAAAAVPAPAPAPTPRLETAPVAESTAPAPAPAPQLETAPLPETTAPAAPR